MALRLQIDCRDVLPDQPRNSFVRQIGVVDGTEPADWPKNRS
jgi:hypothetical protein